MDSFRVCRVVNSVSRSVYYNIEVDVAVFHKKMDIRGGLTVERVFDELISGSLKEPLNFLIADELEVLVEDFSIFERLEVTSRILEEL